MLRWRFRLAQGVISLQSGGRRGVARSAARLPSVTQSISHNFKRSVPLILRNELSWNQRRFSTQPQDKKEDEKDGKEEERPRYWREDYKTNFTTEELLQKQREAQRKQSETSLMSRVQTTAMGVATSTKSIVINIGKGTISLILNPTRIPGALGGAWKTVKHEAYHYWIGFKLMGKNIGTATGILHTALSGKNLTRRERRLLRRTAVDIFRLVPFSIFIIIPFMEFLLPIALRIFPNMLPSSFHSKHEKEDKLKKELQARLQMASFLQETIDDLVQTKLPDDISQKDDISELLTSVRRGQRISNEQIVKVASVFSDELTLENMPRPQLVSLCQYMGVRPFGSNPHLRFVLSQKMQKLKEDDELINAEGVESLTIDELRSALQERGMRTVGLTIEGYRQNLRQWLDLSLDRNVPLSLLILSRAFTILERQVPEEALQETLSAMDEDMVEEVLFSAGVESDAATKLEVLERQAEMMEEEAEERAQRAERRRKIQEAKQQMAEDEEVETKEEIIEIKDKMAETGEAVETTIVISDKVLEEAVEDLEALVKNQAVEEERDVLEALKRAEENREMLDSIKQAVQTVDDLGSEVERMSEAISNSAKALTEDLNVENVENEEILTEQEDLKQKAIEMKQQTEDVAKRLKSRVHRMLENIEKRIDDADKQMEALNVLDTDNDGVITESELINAIKEVLKEHNTEEEAQAIAKEVLSRAGDKMKIGVSTKELIQLSKELRSRNFKKSEEKNKAESSSSSTEDSGIESEQSNK